MIQHISACNEGETLVKNNTAVERIGIICFIPNPQVLGQ